MNFPILIFIYFISIFAFLFYSLNKKQGYLHPPFFIVMAVLFFYTPQIISFSNYYNSLIFEFSSFIIVTLLSVFCFYRGFYGLKKIKPLKIVNKLPKNKISSLTIFLLVFFLILIFYSFISLISLSGGLTNFLYNSYDILIWEGESVILNFFVQLIYILIPTLLVLYFFYSERYLLFMLIISSIIPFIYIIFLNRRLEFFTIGVFGFFYFFLLKQRVFRKAYLIIAGLLALFVLNIFPKLRASDSTFKSALSVSKNESVFFKDEHNEIKNGVLLIGSSLDEYSFNYGFGFFKQVFKDYIPSSFIGRENKNFILGPDKLRILVYNKTMFNIPNNEFVTGFAWVFFELGFVFVLFWLVLGYYLKIIWNKMVLKTMPINFILYVCMFPILLTSVVYSSGVGLGMFIKVLIFLKIIFLSFKRDEKIF